MDTVNQLDTNTSTEALHIITEQLPHLLDKIDIVLISSITLMGFMVASLSILKMIMPKNVNNSKSLKKEIFNMFKYSIWLLIASSILATIAFFFNSIEIMQYIALASFIIFLVSLGFIYKSVDIIFTLENS